MFGWQTRLDVWLKVVLGCRRNSSNGSRSICGWISCVGRDGTLKEKMFVNKIWFSNDVKNTKNNNRNKNNNPSNGQKQQNQIFALDYVCILKNAAVAMCIHVQFMWCVSSARAHIRRIKQRQRQRQRDGARKKDTPQYKLIQSVCKFLQLLICTKRIFALLLDGSALMQLKYSVSMAYTFVSHIQYARIYFLRFLSCSLSTIRPSVQSRSAENFQFKYV